MQLGSSAFVLAVVLFSTHASADPLQKSEDIVKFFAGAAELGPSRGICVGTEDECKSKSKAKDAPAEKIQPRYADQFRPGFRRTRHHCAR